AAATSSVIALLLARANRALVRFRMTSSNQENGFVGLAVVADPAQQSPLEEPSLEQMSNHGPYMRTER
ncbi:hypothetical protein, partial [Bradyrhizobium sp.]|uniref:hypothetical protein n=1 Tax=Bradyrhizobium sp. TaxID=376 RepID=UPI003C769A56